MDSKEAKPSYRIQRLKPNLVLIQWLRTPKDQSPEIQHWLDELKQIVHHATEPVYFLSDLRRGRVTDVRALFELGQLSKHKNWAMGVAFSKSITSEVYAQLFARFSPTEKPIADSLEAALAMLEEQHPGITAGIDWAQIFAEN
ncbi:MAG: hypothetical protein CUN55_08995 [Phototrophicales bacterium]|nr:MAG: hypothetical protein CUN55_08995 [Phototrophicales bacterium]